MGCSKNRLIHIVDDNLFIRAFLTELVEGYGYVVDSYSSPADYIEKVDSDSFLKPLVTFVDVIMPHMNGYEMMKLLHSRVSDMKFIVMSGELDIRSEYKSLACMYLRKPFYPMCVEDVLNKLSECSACGASAEIGCSQVDHRGFYELKEWICPGTVEFSLVAANES